MTKTRDLADLGGGFIQAGSGAVQRTVEAKLQDVVSVKDFGAVGDGVADDTAAIRAAIAANQGKRIYFPPGRYRYAGTNDPSHYLTAGTVLTGAGRDTTTIVGTTSGAGSLFYCQGYGSGIESMGFEAEVTQTTGSYVYLGGPESYIQDFFMTGDYRGVIMTGNVSQIRHGRFQDAAAGGIRIDCGGGDNSQTISNVLMGAQTPANIAAAGIRLRNVVALTMYNVSVIQQGAGLLIDPTSSSENVLNLFVHQCFFDNCTYPIRIIPSGGAAAYRLYFTDVWASSGTNGVFMEGYTGGTIKGVHFTNLQANLNSGSGISTGANVENVSFFGGNVANNAYGFYFNNAINELQIANVKIGAYDGFSGNTNPGITFGASGFTNVKVLGNSIVGNGVAAINGVNNLGAGCRVEANTGHNPVGGSVITVTASPFTYTAGPSPETIYVTGGTVSVIDVATLGMFASTEKTIHLGPKEAMTITYSVAPTVRRSIH